MVRMAVTVCIDNGLAWKDTVEDWQLRGSFDSMFTAICGDMTTNQDIFGCVDEKTYDIEEIVKSQNRTEHSSGTFLN